MTRPQPLLIRITHWLNVPVLVVMAASGLEILAAYPWFGPRGETWGWVPLQGVVAPEWARMGGWLAGARHLHFLFAWLFVVNALVYAGYLVAHRTRLARYQPVQRAAYLVAIALSAILVLSGFAIWKPVQLGWLAAAFGGYDGARLVHFLATVAIAVFTVAHVVMVAVRPRTIVEMITGGRPR